MTPRFILGGPRPCTTFVLRSYTKHELRFYRLAPQYGVNNYCVLYRIKVVQDQDRLKKSEQKHTTKYFVEFHNHSLYYTLFYIRMLFFRPRLNILIFLPILG